MSPLSPSALSLIAANVVPLIGVLFWGWELFPLVALYWFETVIVAAFTIPKMFMARPAKASVAQVGCMNLFLVPFFLMHCGMFMFVHGIFVVALFSDQGEGQGSGMTLLPIFRCAVEVWPCVVLLAVSHGVSFVVNFLGGREWVSRDPLFFMSQPYVRIVPMHLFILATGFASALLGTATPILVLIVVGKTGVDLWSHLRQHRPGRVAAAVAREVQT